MSTQEYSKQAVLTDFRFALLVLIVSCTICVIVSIIASCTKQVFSDKVKGAAAVEIAETVTKK